MKLLRFKVEKFRSVMDSGWIDCDNVTNLVGINEAGKSNLLLALWKLNPAKGGEINLLNDLPRKLYAQLRNQENKPMFIKTVFEASDDLINRLVDLTGADREELIQVTISRNYEGKYFIGFPNEKVHSSINITGIKEIIQSSQTKLKKLEEMGKTEAGIKQEAEDIFSKSLEVANQNETITDQEVQQITKHFILRSKNMKSSTIRPLVLDTLKLIEGYANSLNKPKPSNIKEATQLALEELPSFVYYSNYGNLDSEIYLPHVIDNLQRTDLTGTAEAKVRTLRVLFDFVGLDPGEILDL
jgi:hypothetical protein